MTSGNLLKSTGPARSRGLAHLSETSGGRVHGGDGERGIAKRSMFSKNPRMSELEPNWDKLMKETPYTELMTPMHRARRVIPALVSPKKGWYKLGSEDGAIRADDKRELTDNLLRIYQELKTARSEVTTSVEDWYLLEVDYRRIWFFLQDLIGDVYEMPDGHWDPSAKLGEIYSLPQG